MDKNLNITKPCYSKHNYLPVSWCFVILKFHCTRVHSFQVIMFNIQLYMHIHNVHKLQGLQLTLLAHTEMLYNTTTDEERTVECDPKASTVLLHTLTQQLLLQF